MISVISFVDSIGWHIRVCCRDERFFVIVAVDDHIHRFEFDIFYLNCLAFRVMSCSFRFAVTIVYFFRVTVYGRWSTGDCMLCQLDCPCHQYSVSWCDEACADMSLSSASPFILRLASSSFVLSLCDCVCQFN